jgi:hypothetical protein
MPTTTVMPTTTYNPTTTPYSNTTTPYSNTTTPYSNTTTPYSNTTTPYSNTTTPYYPTTDSSSVTTKYSNYTPVAPIDPASMAVVADNVVGILDKLQNSISSQPQAFTTMEGFIEGAVGETTPAQTTPAQTTPAQTTPAQTTPAQTTPAPTTTPDYLAIINADLLKIQSLLANNPNVQNIIVYGNADGDTSESNDSSGSDFIKDGVKDATGAVKSVVKGAADLTGDGISAVGGDLQAVAGAVGGDLQAVAGAVGGDLQAVASGVGGGIQAVAGGVGGGIKSLIGGGDKSQFGPNGYGSLGPVGASGYGSLGPNGYHNEATSIPVQPTAYASFVNPYTYNGALQSKSGNFMPLTSDFSKFGR